MEKKRPSRYFGDLAWTGRSMSLPARCKSEIIVVITSATKQMNSPKLQRYISIFDLFTE